MISSIDGKKFEECLLIAARDRGRDLNLSTLTASLPLDKDGTLERGAFARSAERAGFTIQSTAIATDRVIALDEPFIVCIAPNEWIYVRAISDDGSLIQIDERGQEAQISSTLWRQAYQGEIYLLKPIYKPHLADHEFVSAKKANEWLWASLRSQWPFYARCMVASTVVNLLALVASFYNLQIYDRVVPNLAIDTMWALSIGVICAYIFDFILRIIRSWLLDMAGKRVDIELSSKLFAHTLSMRMAARPASAGVFANHFKEFESVRDFFTSISLVALIDLPFALLFMGGIAFIGGPMAIAPFVAIPLVAGISFLLQKPIDRSVKATMKGTAQKHGILIETLNGIESLKIVAAESRFQKIWEDSVNEVSKSSLVSRLISNLGVSLAQLVQQITTVCIIIIGVYLVADGKMTSGGIIACTILAGRALAPLSQIASLMTRIEQTRSSVATLSNILNRPTDRPEGRVYLKRDVILPTVEFHAVDFSYPNTPTPALNNCTFKITEGERVAIIGRSGSGKSTVARLICGLYEPDKGSVLVGGADNRQIDPTQLRRSVCYVPQDPFLFSGTVKINISCGAEAPSDADVLRAAQMAGVDDFVRHHPAGYDMPIGEQGLGLSGGQKQMVALARGLISGAHLLVLDEPTNSLDSSGELKLRQYLSKIKDSTLILITHRLPMLELVDRVIVMEGGQIAMDGPRNEVIARLTGKEEVNS